MRKTCSPNSNTNSNKMVSKKAVGITILMLTVIYLVLTSMISVGYACKDVCDRRKGGYLYVDGTPVEDQYDVEPCNTYHIMVCDLPWRVICFADKVEYKVSVEGSDWETAVIEDKCFEFDWHCPIDAEYCTTYVVLYRRYSENGCGCSLTRRVYVARGTVKCRGHLHVIPEFDFGTAMSILSMISGLAVFKLRRK